MILFGIEEFTARRRASQTDLEDALRARVDAAVDGDKDTDGWEELLDQVTQLYRDTYYSESGQRTSGMPRGFRQEIRDTLRKTTERSPASVDRITVWLATAILSRATTQAATDDPEELFLEWVTMEDTDVRDTHQGANRQVQPIGEKYDVGGAKMRYPGDPSVAIELWINCRCTLRPVLASEAITAGGTMPSTSITWTPPINTTMNGLIYSNGTNVIWSPPATAAAEAPTEEQAPAESDPEVAADDVASVPWHGVLAPEGVASGDGRMFAPDSLTTRDLPLPLTWQKASSDGHAGSVTVAKIETIERVDGLMMASGHFIANAEADEVIGLLSEFGKFGVSVDADDAVMEIDEANEMVIFTSARIASASIVAIPAFAEAYVALGPWEQLEAAFPTDGEKKRPADEEEKECEEYDDDGKCIKYKGEEEAPPFALTAAPGTQDGPGWLTHPVDTDRLRDYWVSGPGAAKIGWGTGGDFNRCRLALAEYIKPQYLAGYCANRHKDALGIWPGQHAVAAETLEHTDPDEALHLVAGAGKAAPAAWFRDPALPGPTHLTVTDDGRVFGHIAQWDSCHIGFKGTCTAPPTSSSAYAYFLTGQVALDDGTRAPVGPITIGGGHAGPRLGLRAAIAHYDSTSAVVADVTVGEDAHGIWCSGWVRPGVTDEAVTALMASDVSGDWRQVAGNLELVAALAVNTGGFPVPRTQVAASAQGQVSLVASGMVSSSVTEPASSLALQTVVEMVARELRGVDERRTAMAALAAKVKGV